MRPEQQEKYITELQHCPCNVQLCGLMLHVNSETNLADTVF